MAGAAKRNHAAVWSALQARFQPLLQGAGYLPHAALPAGFDRTIASYEVELVGPPAADGIRVVHLTYSPGGACWFLTGMTYACADAPDRLARLSAQGPRWTGVLEGLPCRQTDIRMAQPWAFWRPVTRRVAFDRKTGQAKPLHWPLHYAERALPAFLAALNRPADPATDPEFRQPLPNPASPQP